VRPKEKAGLTVRELLTSLEGAAARIRVVLGRLGRRGVLGGAALLSVVAVTTSIGVVGEPAGSVGLGDATTTLPVCPSIDSWPVRPVSAAVTQALRAYYAARHLTPVSIYRGRMWVLNVRTESVGVHWCRNVGGGRSGYVGEVPKGASAAVLVRVTHRAYPVTGSATTYATVAEVAKRWRVVGDDTAP
jgi:hypothetical protein